MLELAQNELDEVEILPNVNLWEWCICQKRLNSQARIIITFQFVTFINATMLLERCSKWQSKLDR